MTQRELIKTAKRAYIMTLAVSKGAGADRFSIYVETNEGLQILWPSDSPEGKKAKDLLPHQTFSAREKYPAFHFALSGCGYSKGDEIAEMLRQINPDMAVYSINGWAPMSIKTCQVSATHMLS